MERACVRASVCVCVRACVRGCVHACVRACVCARLHLLIIKSNFHFRAQRLWLGLF